MQTLKANAPILFKPSGKSTFTKFSQRAKALPFILSNSCGKTKLSISVQFLYLQPIITQYFIDNKSEI
ncbi:hypothetical protein, partial [Paraprevotella xylaniphila]|uniref:hypothetical protein n=1 Tax=Paraprevotella xylaniphila TaxID=454155 RepID=UPI0023F034FC